MNKKSGLAKSKEVKAKLKRITQQQFCLKTLWLYQKN